MILAVSRYKCLLKSTLRLQWNMTCEICGSKTQIWSKKPQIISPLAVWRPGQQLARYCYECFFFKSVSADNEVFKWFLSILGFYLQSGRTSYRKISWSLKAVRVGFRLSQTSWNLTGTSATALSRCLVKYQSDTIIITSNLATSIPH